MTGLRRTFDFFRGANDQLVDMFNPISIYKGAHEFGVHEANIYIPNPNGTTEDGDAYARKMGHAVLDSFNPLNKKSAYETGKTATNIGTVIVPGVEELNALRGLKVATEAADGGVVAARAAAERAAGTPGQAAAEEALRAAKARQATAHEAYQAKLPGAGARKIAAKAKAAGKKAKDRRAGGAEPSVRTPAQVAAAEQRFNSQKQGALEEARHQQLHRRQPALAGGRSHPAGVARPSEAPSGNSTAAIGRQSLIKRMLGDAKGRSKPPLRERIRLNRNIKTRPDVEPVKSTKEDYWVFDLAKKSREFRRTYVDPETGKVGYWGTGNVVVYEYKGPRDANGNLPTFATKSIRHGPGEVGLHSEPNGLQQLHDMGVNLKDITRVYTEREPCMLQGNYCATLLSSELPDVPVFHSFEYGNPEARAAGNKLLTATLKQAKGSNQ